MENSGVPHDQDTQSENPGRQEPYEGTSAFPWMGHYQSTPVEAFPTLQGPIVHEGFVPDDDGGMDIGNQVDYAADWSASVLASYRPGYQPGFTGSLDDQFTDHHSPRSQSETARYAAFEDRDGDSLDQYSSDDNDSSLSDDDSQ
jgi:hypothetical protein